MQQGGLLPVIQADVNSDFQLLENSATTDAYKACFEAP